MIAIILAEALFSATFLFGKLALEDGRPFFVSGYRTLLGSLILLSAYALFCHKKIRFSRKLALRIFLMGFFWNYLAVGLRFWGLQYVPIAKASFIYNMSPFLTAILSAYFFSQRLTALKIVGLTIGFIGFFPVFYNHSTYELSLRHIGFFSSAELTLVLASVAAVLGSLIFKDVIERRDCHFMFASSVSMLIGSLFNLATSLIIEPWDPLPLDNVYDFLLWTTLLTLSSNVISYSVYGKLLTWYSASLLSFAGMLIPVFSTISGMIFLGEQFEWYIVPSLIIITFGLYIFYREELKLGYVKTAS